MFLLLVEIFVTYQGYSFLFKVLAVLSTVVEFSIVKLWYFVSIMSLTKNYVSQCLE